ncbi:MAG: hypothetical protein JWN78_1615 [Bacteroidota bacterium]|nr:hypothetical protein [Bacteroidota bacterium]
MKIINERLLDLFESTGKQKQKNNPLLLSCFTDLSNQDRYYPIEYNPETQLCYGFIEKGDQTSKWDYFNIEEINNKPESNIWCDYSFTPIQFSFLDIDHYNNLVDELSKEDQEKYERNETSKDEMKKTDDPNNEIEFNHNTQDEQQNEYSR